MCKILKQARIKMVYCGVNEFKGKAAVHTINPSQEELKYAVILAQTRGHNTVYVHYDNVVSLDQRRTAKEEPIALES